MPRFDRVRLCASSIALGASLLGAFPAAAQDGSQRQDAAQGNETQTATNDGGINTIVVTARRQEETLQDAALAIDAVSGAALTDAGIQVADDLTKAVPAISIVNGGGQATSIFLRGVGNITNNSYYDAAISPSFDGVVLGRPSGAFASAFYDLARVEVLKGPQGILYGRNATGGAVNIIPNHPRLGDSGFGFTTSLGNYDAFSTEGFINLATSDNSALRIAGTYQTHDGYNADGSDDLDRRAARAQYLIEPSDNLSLRLAADYTEIGGVGAGGDYLGHFQGGNFIPSGLPVGEGLNTPAANAYRQTVLGAPGFGFLNPLNRQQSIDAQYWGVHAEANLETSVGTVTFIPAYRETESTTWFYGPAFNTALFDEAYEQLSLELRLAGSAGMFDYILGGFYFNEDVAGVNEFNQEFVLPMQNFVGGTKSWASFGQLTANVSDVFRLVGGLRYTEDKKFLDGNITNFITFCGPKAPPPVTPPASFGVGCQLPGALPRYPNFTDPREAFDWLIGNGWISPGSVYNPDAPAQRYPLLNGRGAILKAVSAPSDSGTFNKITWKAGAEFDITPDSLLYASIETGYRAGGFQLAEGSTTYDPESIIAYTIGSKNRFFDDKLQVNAEAFYWRYKDQQITFFTISPNGVLVSANQNVGRSDIKGFDFDVILAPLRHTRLMAKVQYLDTQYKDLILRTAPPRDNFNCPRSLDGRLSDGVTPIFAFDCSGYPLLFAPKWSLNFGIEQSFDINDRFELVAKASTAWRDEQYGSFNFLDFQLIPSYWVSDAVLRINDVDNGVSLAAYVNNIEGNRQISFPQASPIGFAVARRNPPRTYGLRLSAEF